jgi:tetratricopeptide (TPR) repeat protein
MMAALTSAMSDRTMHYQQYCQELADMSDQPKYQEKAISISRTCSLLPDAIADEDFFEQQMLRLLKDKESRSRNLALTALLYRVGKYQDALAMSEQVKITNDNWAGSTVSQFWQSMSHSKLGNRDEAEQAFARGIALVNQNYPEPGIAIKGELEQFEVPLLKQQAEQLLSQFDTPEPTVEMIEETETAE